MSDYDVYTPRKIRTTSERLRPRDANFKNNSKNIRKTLGAVFDSIESDKIVNKRSFGKSRRFARFKWTNLVKKINKFRIIISLKQGIKLSFTIVYKQCILYIFSVL